MFYLQTNPKNFKSIPDSHHTASTKKHIQKKSHLLPKTLIATEPRICFYAIQIQRTVYRFSQYIMCKHSLEPLQEGVSGALIKSTSGTRLFYPCTRRCPWAGSPSQLLLTDRYCPGALCRPGWD